MTIAFRTLTAFLISLLLTANLCHLYGQANSPSPLARQFSLHKNEIEERLGLSNSKKPDTTSPGQINPLDNRVRVNSFSTPVVPEAIYRPGAALRANFDYPLNDCFTYTFKLSIATPAGETTINETFTATDGSNYIVGLVMTTAGQKQGLIKKLDHVGNITWSKSLTYAGRNTTIQSIRELSGGNLVLIGTTEIGDGTARRIFIAELTPAGAVTWSKSLSTVGFKGMGISPTPANGIAFCGNDDSTLVYGNLSYTGNLLWLKKIRLFEKGAVVGMGRNDYNAWYIAYSGMDSARHVGALVQFNWTDGAIDYINKLGGNAANSDFILHDLETTNIRPRITGIYSINTQPYKPFKLTGNVTGNYESIITFDIPSVSFDTTASTSITPWAETILVSPGKNDPAVYAVKMITESNPETMVHWMKKFDVTGFRSIANIERSFDGGFLMSVNRQTANGEQGYILKTDSIGVIKNCEGSSFNVSATIVYNGIVATLNPTAATITGSMVTDNSTVTEIAVADFFECKELTCPPIIPEDPCISSFARRYRSSGFCDLGLDMLIGNQNEITMVGVMRDNPYDPTTERAALITLDGAGKLLARKTANLGTQTVFHTLRRTRDGNILVLGSSVYRSSYTGLDTGYMTVSKLSANLQLIWNQSFPFYSPYSALYGIEESQDGSIFVNYVEEKGFCLNLSLLKLNSAGQFEWGKDFSAPSECIFGYVGSMTQDNDHIYLMNWATPHVIFLKVQKTTGTLVSSKGYEVPNTGQTLVARNLSFIGENLVVQGMATNPNSSMDVVMLLDKNGNLKMAKSFSKDGYAVQFEMVVTKNNELVLASSGYDNSYFLRLDSTLNTRYSKKIYSNPAATRKIKEGLDGSIYDVGYFWYPNVYTNDISLKKYSAEGLLGSCAVDTMVLASASQPIIQVDLNVQVNNNTINLQSLPYNEQSYSLQQNSLFCSKPSTCGSLKIIAQTSVCDTLTHTITARRNNDCNTLVYFSYTQENFKVISRTDSSMTVQFIKSGTTRLFAKLFTGCKWLEDSIDINSTVSFQSLNLGSDTVLCSGNSLLINASAAYATYLWSTGSRASTINVNNPGTYYVDATDACGIFFTDTINVSAAPPIPFDLGMERAKCNNDTLRLKAPDGFLNYTWGPDYNTSSTSGQTIIVQPLTDTSYFVKAEKTAGCFAFDTIRVKVNHSAAIELGNDQSFCAGDNVMFDAGPGFVNYAWSDGSSSQKIIADAQDEYSVIATTAEGCRSYDTVRIAQVWANPVVVLPGDTPLCSGETLSLFAGTHSSYLWQDGSTAPTFEADNPGIYYVTVWDNNQCKGTDTIRITDMLPLPANFLPADTFICSYGNLVLASTASFAKYSWNTSANTSFITITEPGIYWLIVTDNNNCAGVDTMVVNKKDCLTGFYVPNAFTPNNDGLNDLFRPIIGGNVIRYQFSVYNRWGQIVFRSEKIHAGWNGSYLGKQQDGNVFIWTCTYQLEGGTIKNEKGTVVLVR